MQCKEVRNQFPDHLNRGEPASPEVEQHLNSCEACRSEFEALKGTWLSLDSIHPEVPDSSAMRARFLGMLEAYEPATPAMRSSGFDTWLSRWWPRQPILQVALATVLVVLGFFAGRETPRRNPEIGQLRADLHEMRQMVALSLMQQESANDRLRGVSWSTQIDQPDGEVLTALLNALHDPNVNVRLATVEALKKFGERQLVRGGVVRALDQQESPLVQIALIDFMVETREKEFANTLRLFSEKSDLDGTVREHAQWGLEHLE